MYDLFYIIEVSPQWYNLIVKGTHYCIACGSDLEKIKRTIYNYVRKYKIEDRVYSALRGLDDCGKVAPAVFESRKKRYDSGHHLVFNDLIKEVVAQAIKDNRQDTPYHHAKKKVRTVTPVEQVRTTPLPPPNEVNEPKRAVGKIRPLSIKRTTVLSGQTTE